MDYYSIGFFAAEDRKHRKIIYTLLIIMLFFIIIAKGSNPPLGELYRYLVTHFPLARIFRTTSSVITGAVLFYAFLFAISTYYLSKNVKLVVYIIVLINIVVFYPLYFGCKFYNVSYAAPDQKGYAIPAAYYDMGKQLDGIKEDSKVLSIPLIGDYVYKNWPYYGPDILSWITKKPLIYRADAYGISTVNKKKIFGSSTSYKIWALNNVGYMLFQKDSVGGESFKYKNPVGALLVKNDYFELYKIPDDYFLPHIYPAPATYFLVEGDVESLISLAETEYLDGNPVLVLANQIPETRGQIPEANKFVFRDSNYQDLAVDMAWLEKWEIKETDWKMEKSDKDKSHLKW